MQAVNTYSALDLVQFSSASVQKTEVSLESPNRFDDLVSKAAKKSEVESSSPKVEKESSEKKLEQNENTKNSQLQTNQKENTVSESKKTDSTKEQKLESVSKKDEKSFEKIPIRFSKKTEETDNSKKRLNSDSEKETDFSKIVSKEKTTKKAEKNTLKKENEKFSAVDFSKKDDFEEKDLIISQDLLSETDISALLDKSQIVSSKENPELLPDDFEFSLSTEDISYINAESSSLKEETEVFGKKFYLDSEKKISVTDLRSEQSQEESKENISKSGIKIVSSPDSVSKNAEITMEVFSDVQQNISSSTTQNAASTSSNFQSMLSNQIQQNAPEIVKAGNILLKDNNAGSIKLILHPESLGNVKIDLQISEKSITGRIIVQTQEAFNAFKESAESLRQAFKESGFENAGLNLAFAGQNSNQNQFAGENQNQSAAFRMNLSYKDFTEVGNAEFEEEIFENSLPNSINIVA